MLLDHIKKIKYFHEVAASGSLHGAARKLRISQPALSHTIKILEDTLGTDLFQRSRKGMRLTQPGLVLFEFSKKLMKEVAEVEVKVLLPHDPLAGRLTVGCYDVFAAYLWPKLLREIAKSHPQLKVNLTINNSNRELTSQLMAGQIDLAIMAEPNVSSEFHYEHLYQETYGFYGSKHIPEKKLLTKAQLQKQPLISFSKAVAGGGRTLIQLLAQHGLTDAISHSLESFEAVMKFAREGLGVAILPRLFTDKLVKDDKLHYIRVTGIRTGSLGSQRLEMVMPKLQQENPQQQLLVTLARALVS